MKFFSRPLLFHSESYRTISTGLNHTSLRYSITIRYLVSEEIDRLKSLKYWLAHRTHRQWTLAGSVVSVFVVLFALGLTALFTSPQNHTYSFAGDNCFFNPIFLPSLVTQNKSDAFKTEMRPKLTIGRVPIISTSTCIQITSIPNTETGSVITLESFANIQKNISLDIVSLPSLRPYDSLKQPVSSTAVLLFSLDQLDSTFSYTLKIGNITTDCILHASLLGCPLTNQKLAQGQTYKYEISRVLSSRSAVALTESISTLAPVTVNDSTVKQSEVIYDYLKEIMLTTNKPITSIGKYSLISSDGQDFPMTSTVQDSTATLAIPGDLPRNTNFILTVESMTSDDGAYLSEPYVLNFKTSAGPQAQGINISSYKVSQNSSITISFDIELEAAQSIEQFVSLNDANGAVPASISVQNNTVTIDPDGTLGICNSYTVSISDGIKNKFGISGNSAWSTNFRTICQQTFTVGSSVQGRSITGYRFGSGSTYVVFVGGLHGNEQSSTLTLNSWVEELERNYQNIPSDKTIIVIPNTNPDGYAVDTRLNANGVDLNRNFPANNWQTGVYVPPNTYLETGGGAKALSEPESSSLANYLLAVSPRLVLTFHATARAVISNGAGDASAVAQVYSHESGLTKYEQHDEDGIFSYTTTGEMEDWLRDKHNIPTLLVELRTQYSNEITRQKSAMWAMLSL
jgi:protein MpaA